MFSYCYYFYYYSYCFCYYIVSVNSSRYCSYSIAVYKDNNKKNNNNNNNNNNSNNSDRKFQKFCYIYFQNIMHFSLLQYSIFLKGPNERFNINKNFVKKLYVQIQSYQKVPIKIVIQICSNGVNKSEVLDEVATSYIHKHGHLKGLLTCPLSNMLFYIE